MAVALAALAPARAEARTLVAAIASDVGLASELPLSFAEADARLVLSTWAAVVPDAERRAELRVRATPATARALIDGLARDAGPDDAVVVFVSGHGDARGAHLGGEVWPWRELDAALSAVRARVVILVVDSCQSGALLGPKGFVRGPPLAVKLEARAARGRFYLTSSGANEVSHESARLGGSPFAHHLVSGLRGAADEDRDGAVTVSELYRHVYARTVASTLAAPLGPQRPEQAVVAAGAGEVVVARARGARVVGAPSRLCWVLDADEARVLAELAGDRAIALPPGKYAVKCAVDEGRVDRADLVLPAAGEVAVDALSFTREGARYALAKGGAAPWSVALEVAGAVRLAGGEPSLAVALAATWQSPTVSVPVQVWLMPRDERAEVLALVGATYRLPWWQVGRLDVGVALGAGTDALAVGQLARWWLGRSVPVRVGLDVLTRWEPGRESAVTVEALLSVGLALPVSAAPGNSLLGEDDTR